MGNNFLKFQLKATFVLGSKVEYLGGKLYNSMASKARKNGYEEIANAFEGMAKSEMGHGRLLDSLRGKLQ